MVLSIQKAKCINGMKIGILNLQSTRANYGAVLQAAALEEFIREKTGCEVEHLNYMPPEPLPRKVSVAQFLIWKIDGFNKRLSVFLGHPIPGSLNDVGDIEVFEQFRESSISRTEALYNLEDLKEASQNYDVVVVGSDQIWRLAYTRQTFPAFFLSFVPDKCRKIAYAASFGTDRWEGDAQETREAAAFLCEFAGISVREKSGVDICRNVFDVEATHVLDPVLLVGRSYFNDLVNSNVGKTTAESDIVYYRLRGGTFGFNEIKKAGEQAGYSVENIYYRSCPSVSGDQVEHFFYSVTDWLAKIKTCRKMLVTDSFHGICFALLFEKNFIWIPNKEAGTSRLDSLLGELGLMERKCTSLVAVKRTIKASARIDYGKVNARLKTLREASADFLIDATKYEVK